MTRSGIVSLVGAGPGDPELITLRGVRALASADLVLYDYLVNPAILRHLPLHCEQICLGSHGRASLWPPEKIHAAMIAGATQGKRVVRLKGGDPLVFGRAAAELEALARSGISFEIIPGITAGLSAASYAGLPITDRDVASAVAFITGQEDPHKCDGLLDCNSLAQFPGTLMIYMGVTTARHWTDRLMQAGKDPDTPVALIRRCTWPNQEQILCRLADVADCVTPYSKFPPPVIAIVGEVARSIGRWNWFLNRPLSGQTVLVTRPRQQVGELCDLLLDAGAEVLVQPAIEIGPPDSWCEVDRAIHALANYTHVLFTSSNGVDYFVQRLVERRSDVRCLAAVRLVAVGPATAAALQRFHLAADVVPDESYQAESLVGALLQDAKTQGPDPLRCLWVRTDRGRDTLAHQLTAAGAQVDAVVAYQSRDVVQLDPVVEQRLREGTMPWVTATSSAIARSLVSLLGENSQPVLWASLSPLTSDALRAVGVKVSAEAAEASMRSLCDALSVAVRSAPNAHDP